MRKDILKRYTVKSRYEHNQSKIRSFGKQTQFDSCFYLPNFKLSSQAISLHAYNSFLRAFLKSTNDLSYRIGKLRTSSPNLSSAIFIDREEIWNSVSYSCAYARAYFRPVPISEISVISISASTRKRKMLLFLVLMLVLISHQCRLAFSCAYACAYLASVNQALSVSNALVIFVIDGWWRSKDCRSRFSTISSVWLSLK